MLFFWKSYLLFTI